MLRPFVITFSACALLALVVSTAFAWNDARAKAEQERNQLASWRDDTVIHVVVSGDTLFNLSQRYYGDPTRWRRIARENDIADPSRLTVGTRLNINGVTASVAPAPSPTVAVRAEPLASVPLRLAKQEVNAEAEAFGGNVVISIRANLGDGTSTLLSQSYPESFRYMYAEDGDHDGEEELYTVWRQGEDAYFTRVFREREGALGMSEAIPENPWAMKHEPNSSW